MVSSNLMQALGAMALVAGGTGPAFAADGKGVSYLNGGIGSEAVTSIERRQADYNLRMVFSEGPRNEYVAGLRLAITDPQGRPVLSLGDAGPLTDVRLPPGPYHVRAELGDVARSYTIELKDGQPFDLYLHWPAAHGAG